MSSQGSSMNRKTLLLLFYICAPVTVLFLLIQQPHTVPLNRHSLYGLSKVSDPEQQPASKMVDSSSLNASRPVANHSEATPSQGRFYVNSKHCKMPYVNPFSPEIMKTYEPLPLQNCTTVDRLVQTIFDENLQRYRLHINEDVGRSLRNFTGDIACCYKEIVRKQGDDDRINILPCSNFHQDFVVPVHIEGIIVECYSANYTKLLQMDGFSLIQMKNRTNISASNSRKPSVLMIGIDALSRINFRRTMLKTYGYLKQNGWHEMQGYNKMGDNTFPNLMAVLAGYDEETALAKCDVHGVGGIDSCPLIWKNFHEYGYRTAYAEDECDMSTFNYCKLGFQNPPTDYYLRPFMMAFEDYLPEKKRCGLRNCLGMRHTAQYIYDFATQLTNRYNDEPVFGLFWSNSFSHNCYDTTSAMDHVVHGYLQEFEEAGVLETSIVILFSDHGMRWGTLTNLPDGFLEERLPMLFFSLPKWFSHKYPQFVRALEHNKHRLTSPYDLHMTLKHLVELASDGRAHLQPAEKCAQCQSLFREVPENRTCEEAGIPDHWCTCTPYEVIKRDARVEKVAGLIIREMNLYLSANNFSSLCSELTSPNLRAVFRKMLLDGDHDLDAANTRTYRLKFETQPNDALFEATTVYHEHNNTVDVDVESISRLNSYEADSKCIDDKQAKKYCICRNAIEDGTS